MRLFIAVLFNDSILNELTGLQNYWRNIGVRGNFTPLQNLHLTLSFIGEYGTPDSVLDVMSTVPFSPFSVRLDGIGNFDDLFWVGIAKNTGLTGYVNRLRKSLAENGIPYDRKRFSPHITLVRRAVLNCGVNDILKKVPIGSMEVKSISLMSSTRGKNGMIYTQIGSIEAIR